MHRTQNTARQNWMPNYNLRCAAASMYKRYKATDTNNITFTTDGRKSETDIMGDVRHTVVRFTCAKYR